MKLFSYGKDGGPKSPVDGFWLVEIKGLFSIVLLRFNDGGREAYHSHAFNALSWFLWGNLTERSLDFPTKPTEYTYKRSFIPKVTPRICVHRVNSVGSSWVLSLRGPWQDTWHEIKDDKKITLTHGRKEV